jgi:uncharacterized protein (TIGR03437 family)
MLLPIGANAQSYPLPDGNQILFTGSWPSQEQQAVLDSARQLWPALAGVAHAAGSQWTVAYQAQNLSSDPCSHSSMLNGQADLITIARHLNLAMFTVCEFARADRAGGYTEGQAQAKAMLALRALAGGSGATVSPATSLGAAPANLGQRYFAAGAARSFAENGANRDAVAAVFEVFGAKLGGSTPTLAPLDAAWAQVSASTDDTATADQRLAPFFSAADRLLGSVAGRSATAWIKGVAAAFTLDSAQRSTLGMPPAGGPTDGRWLEAYALGAMPGWGGSQSIVNSTTVRVILKQRQAGVTTVSGTGTARFRILDQAGASELYAGTADVGSGSGTLSIPASSISALSDGAYPAETCILQADGKACDPQLDLYQPVIVDHSGWTTGKLVVIANGPAYSALHGETLSLAAGQPAYVLTAVPGAVAIGGLPASYTEVVLSDGTVTRRFPWVPDVPGGNIWTWTPFDDPGVLSILDAATFQPALSATSFGLAPNTWYTLATVGATPGGPDITAVDANRAFPVRACANEYGSTSVVFSANGQSWNAAMDYCSWGQINVLTPSTLPAGQTVTLQVSRNGSVSNPISATVAAAGPSLFLGDAVRQLGAVIFAAGAQAGSVVTPELPAHVGDALSIYYTGCGPLSEPLPAGQAAPMDHLVYATLPAAVTVGDATADVTFNGLAPGFSGLCQLNFVVPPPVTGTTSFANTLKTGALQLAINQQNANAVLLPVVFEPNASYLGNPAAKVTVVQYGDYQCPYCAAFFRTTFPQLKQEYIDTGKIRFQYQDLAFLGADSTTSAMAAHCAGDQYRFWQYHDYLYAHQAGENSGWGSPDRQKQFATALGLDTVQFNACLDSRKYAQEVANEGAAAKSQSINSVPSFLINGTLVVGNQPLATFEQAINAALSQ